MPHPTTSHTFLETMTKRDHSDWFAVVYVLHVFAFVVLVPWGVKLFLTPLPYDATIFQQIYLGMKSALVWLLGFATVISLAAFTVWHIIAIKVLATLSEINVTLDALYRRGNNA